MGLEDEARGLETARQAEAERRRLMSEAAENALAPLLQEFAGALRQRGIRPIPVHAYRVVEPARSDDLRRFYVTPDVYGQGWAFRSHEENDGYTLGSDMVLMDDGMTLIRPLGNRILQRPKGRFFRGYWPTAEFACWSGPLTLSSVHDVAPIKQGMIRYLDQHDRPAS